MKALPPAGARIATRMAIMAAALLLAAAAPAEVRDQVRVVGSSTVFPYSQAVAEQFADVTDLTAPVVEATGTGGGMQVFCGGVGPGFPDATGASRPMTRSEYDLCRAHGVVSVTEVAFGIDGLSLAHAVDAPDMDLTAAQLFQALAAEVEVAGRIVPNPYRRWREIDPGLPDLPIRVFGPPPTSGTRDAFVELVMHPGCAAFPALAALPENRRTLACGRMRQDGPFIEAGENDNVVVRRLEVDPTAVAIFGYSFLHENRDKLKAVAVDGVLPDPATIGSGAYPVTRPLFLYVKNAHRGVIPGLDRFLEEYVSEDAIGPHGYLSGRGLIPLPAPERAAMRAAVAARAPMARFARAPVARFD